jgi:hypothetical protein
VRLNFEGKDVYKTPIGAGSTLLLILFLLGFALNDFIKILSGEIKTIINSEEYFEHKNESLDLSKLDNFNFAFGVRNEQIPLSVGTVFAEYVQIEDNHDDEKKTKKIVIPLSVESCKENKDWNKIRKE